MEDVLGPSTPLVSATPPVIFPVPSAAKDPAIARKPELLKPLRVNAYGPLKTDSLPELEQAAAAALTLMLSDTGPAFAAGWLESDTDTVKVVVPEAVGVPEIWPVAVLKDNHAGSEEGDTGEIE